MRLCLKEGTCNTLFKIILGAICTSPNSVTLTLYPFGRETSIGIGKVLILIRQFLLKVMWFDAPESMIHKLALDSKHLHEGLSKSVDEEQTTIPAKYIDPAATLETLLASASHSHSGNATIGS